MALRARMHPRNIYRTPTNFKELAITYPEFRKFVKQELSGKVTIDFSDRQSVLELTKLLLLKDFNLIVEINEARLIPRVPLCLNYLLWIEDLLNALDRKSDIKGIDIGTGSVCVYSLLASTKGWQMLATEVDKTSYECACKNVQKNNLKDKITLKLVENSNKILEGVIDNNLTYDFCMCNPPFFDDNEPRRNRTTRRKMIETTASYVNTDIKTKGGELEFIKQIITESQKLKKSITIYTTLVGKKADLNKLKKLIAETNCITQTDTEFCQGNTIRWGLAWSFSNINLTDVFNSKSFKVKKTKAKTLMHIVAAEKYSLERSCEIIQNLLQKLKISYTEEIIFEGCAFTLKAHENTWSHQRRKNRLRKKKDSKGEDKETEKCLKEDSSHCDIPTKKMRLDIDDKTSGNTSRPVLVEGLIVVKKNKGDIVIEMAWLSGHKESLHQIFQYIKNNWEKCEYSEGAIAKCN